MSGGSDTMAPLNAVLETFGREVSVLTEKVSALEKDASSKTGVIDKQKGEISSLKAEVDERVQQIDSLKGEISGVKKTMDERAQQITDLQKQLSASLKENETLLEENKTLQTIGSPEQRKDDAGAAGSKRDGSAALEDGQPAKAQRTEAAADAALSYAVADAGGGAAEDGSGTPSSDATEEMITETALPEASLAEAGLSAVAEVDEICDEIGEGASEGADEGAGEGAGEGAPGEGTPEAAASSEAGASGALLQLQEREADRLLPPSAGVAQAVLQLVHYSSDVKDDAGAWIKETVLALRQDGSLYAFASTSSGADLSRQGAEAAEGSAGSCGRCLLGPVDEPASVEPAEMRMQHGPKKMVVVARQGEFVYLNHDEHIFEHGCHGDAACLALSEEEQIQQAAVKDARGIRCKDLRAQTLFSSVIDKVHERGREEDEEELVNFSPTGFVFNESSANLVAIASKNGIVVAKQAAAEGPEPEPEPEPEPQP